MTETLFIDLPFIRDRRAVVRNFDGVCDDLLSGGRGFDGFRDKKAPAFENPDVPDTRTLRTRTLWYNYRALMDVDSRCYGTYYGPGTGYGAPALIAGREIMALSEEGVTMMVQIPRHFNPQKPVLVAVPSSGSRGIYGGIGVVGEWALKRGFAAVYTDKGTGVGYHLLDDDTVILMDGRLASGEHAGEPLPFDALSGLKGAERRKSLSEHNRSYPHRIAVRHAHSGINLQENWGRYVLESIAFGRTVLEKDFPGIGKSLKVIAAGISNGGLSSIMAKEQDSEGLIHAVAVSEPNVTPFHTHRISIVQGNAPKVPAHSMSLADYATLFNIYLPCAALAKDFEKAPFRLDAFGLTRAMCENRCLSLRDKGLLRGENTDELSRHALSLLRSIGVNRESEILLPSHYTLDVARSIAVTYVSQYAGARVFDHLAGFSFAATDPMGRPRALTRPEAASLFSDQSGIPPFTLIKLINDHNPDGPLEDRQSVSPSTGRMDMNLDGALALRRLVTGVDEQGNPVTGTAMDLHLRITRSMDAIKVTGNLKGCPAVMVTGRCDAVLPINHTSRPYLGANALAEGGESRLRYYEVTEAHHVDALNMLYKNPDTCDSPMDFAPLHVVYLKALDLMVDHLENRTALPPSQVIRPVPPYHTCPEIVSWPEPENRIDCRDGVVFIPE